MPVVNNTDAFLPSGNFTWMPYVGSVTGYVSVPIANFRLLPPLSSVTRSVLYITTLYETLSPLPPGLVLNPLTGAVSGTATTTGTTTVDFIIIDTQSRLQVTVGTVTFIISLAPAASSLNPITYAVPIAVVVFLILLVLFLLFLRERRKNAQHPHNFEEMLAALRDFQADQDERRVPREIKRDKIKLLDMIGSGNFGQVHKGLLDEIPGTPGYIVAVKLLKVGVDGADAERGSMLREAALTAQFSNEFVIGLVGVVTLGEPLLVLLEYCEHGALQHHLQKSATLTNQQRYQFTADCAEGMAYLAKHNFVHRDLAARNVLLNSEYRCKIADFGLSREIVDSNYYQSKGGQLPVRWTATEALEEHKFSSQSDVWSFGIMMYEIWTKAETPYKEMSNQKVWTEVMAGYRLKQPFGCPDEAYELMRSCWVVCGHRPEFEELKRALRRMASVEPKEDASREMTVKLPAPTEYVQFIRKDSAQLVDASFKWTSPVKEPRPSLTVIREAASELGSGDPITRPTMASPPPPVQLAEPSRTDGKNPYQSVWEGRSSGLQTFDEKEERMETSFALISELLEHSSA